MKTFLTILLCLWDFIWMGSLGLLACYIVWRTQKLYNHKVWYEYRREHNLPVR